ncbi:hypothetical protein JL09_g559 [Pichia kudriavzevii]|uniref:SWR1-complex protein 5 n=1 Tax=Pichia kudriavzevii TaxID=4909 RepID=A0A099P557_PICKU|nr:hypothetical protein JL09_g559 [Pichia kudriavzevii]
MSAGHTRATPHEERHESIYQIESGEYNTPLKSESQETSNEGASTKSICNGGNNEQVEIQVEHQQEEEDDDEEDEDYVLAANNDDGEVILNDKEIQAKSLEGDDDDEEDYIQEEDLKEMAKYSSIESNEGGLVKTRRQRQLEAEQERQQKKSSSMMNQSKTSNADINSIWAELNSMSSSRPNTTKDTAKQQTGFMDTEETKSSERAKPTADSVLKPQTIKITRTYEFAGKMITEEKEVDADSEEAKAHLNSTAIKGTPKEEEERKSTRCRLTNSSTAKLSTLEKSRLDWANFVDKSKISEELKYNNKGGFLEKQDFLNRVESRRDGLLKEAKSKK